MRLYGNDPIRFCRNKGLGGELGTKTKNAESYDTGSKEDKQEKDADVRPSLRIDPSIHCGT